MNLTYHSFLLLEKLRLHVCSHHARHGVRFEYVLLRNKDKSKSNTNETLWQSNTTQKP